MSDNNKGSLLLSFLYPEDMNEIEKVEFALDLRNIVAKAISQKYPMMRYLLADEEYIKKEVRESLEKKL